MPYCPKCGVEVDGGILSCPLCTTDIPDLGEKEQNLYPDKSELLELTPGRKRMITWRVISIALAMSGLLSLAADWVSYKEVTFSRYVIASVILVWFYVTFLIFLFKRVTAMTFLSMTVTIMYLAVLDACNGKFGWFLPLGLPISLLAGGSGLTLRFVWSKMRMRKANFWAVFLLVAVVFCIGLNLLISGYSNDLKLSWSIIVMAALVPLSGLLFYLHYGLSRKIDYRKFFHT